MGLEEDVLKYALSPQSHGLKLLENKEGKNTFEEEFFYKYQRTIGLIEYKLVEELRYATSEMIWNAKRDKTEPWPDVRLSQDEVEKVGVAPLRQMLLDAQKQYIKLRVQNVTIDEAFETVMASVSNILQQLSWRNNEDDLWALHKRSIRPTYQETLGDYLSLVKQELQPLFKPKLSEQPQAALSKPQIPSSLYSRL